MKLPILFLSTVLMAATTPQLRADLLFYDSFNYGTSGTSLGTAGSPTWVKNGASPDPTVVGSAGLSYAGLQVSSDTFSLQYDGSGVNAAPLFIERRLHRSSVRMRSFRVDAF